jgi:hypothetical protein
VIPLISDAAASDADEFVISQRDKAANVLTSVRTTRWKLRVLSASVHEGRIARALVC